MSAALSPAAGLLVRACDRVIAELSLTEVPGNDGGPLIPLVGVAGPVAGQSVGALRVFAGAPLLRAVTIDLVVPMFGVDSHMLFAFTHPDSPVPHFTLDSVFAGGSFAFHLDLIPRVDLGAQLAYMNAVYAPLTEVFEATRRLDGLSPAQIGPRQVALMSPWMLVSRADEAAFRKLDGAVDAYLGHWLALVRDGVPAAALDGVERDRLAVRDQRNKAAIFDPAVDPVWAQVDRLIGEPTAVRLRDLLRRGES